MGCSVALFMAWRGSFGDTRLWWSQTRDGKIWSPQQRVFGAASTEKPALAAWRGLLYLAWRDAGPDQTLWWAAYDGRGWSGPRPVPGAASSHAPALVANRGGLHLYWKGAGGDERLWQTMFDGRSWSPPQALFDGWPMTASRPAATATHTTSVWLAFTGAGQDRTVHLCPSPDGTLWNHGDVTVGPAMAVSAWPSLAGRAGRAERLLLAWPDHDGRVWCSICDDAARHWSLPVAAPVRSLRGVGFADWGTVDAYAAWAVAPEEDYGIFWADTAGGTAWRDPVTGSVLRPGQRRLEGRVSLREPAMAAFGRMWR